MINETIDQKNIESEVDMICEDDRFEIAVLNNRRLEIKTISI